jgi:hypothetical protein
MLRRPKPAARVRLFEVMSLRREKADVKAFALFCPNSHYLNYLRNASLTFE